MAPGESSTWQRREPRNRLFSTSSLVEEVHGSASSISTGMCNLKQVFCTSVFGFPPPLTCPVFWLKLTLCYFCQNQVGILSPGSFDFSHDEGFDSEDDSDHYEDFDDSDSGIFTNFGPAAAAIPYHNNLLFQHQIREAVTKKVEVKPMPVLRLERKNDSSGSTTFKPKAQKDTKSAWLQRRSIHMF